MFLLESDRDGWDGRGRGVRTRRMKERESKILLFPVGYVKGTGFQFFLDVSFL